LPVSDYISNYCIYQLKCFETLCRSLYDEAISENLNPNDYLDNNDSFNFFKSLKGGEYLLSPGHTGTNVMDIQMLVVTL